MAGEFLPSSGHFGFGRQALDFGALRLLQVADLLKIVARTGQRRFGFTATILVLAHAGGFFQIHAQLLRLGLDEVADHALADDRVGAGPQAGAHEDVLHVAAAHLLIVDEVRIAAVARDDALDGKLRIAPPGPLDRAVGVVEHQFDRSAGRCRTIHRTRKMSSLMDVEPRNSETRASPSTQRMASITLDLPQPLGPTIPATAPGNSMTVVSAKLLKPEMRSCFRRTVC